MKTSASCLFFLLVLGGLGACLDGPPDHSGDWSASDAITEQQAEAAAQASRDFAAQQVCGPNAGHRWADDKTLVCSTKHGKLSKQVQL